MKAFFAKVILKYLQTLTRYYVKRNKIDIFGLTGSVGKTTLTIALYAVLSKKYKVGMTFREGQGLNSESGIPFAILDVHVEGYSPVDWVKYLIAATKNFFFKKSEYDKFIIEMGVDKPGDMDFILSMTRADLGIFLSISKVHTENFERLLKEKKSDEELLDLVFQEKAKVIKSLEEDGWAVLNYDEPMIRSLEKYTRAQTITFGLSKGADVRGISKEITTEKFEAEIYYKDQKETIKVAHYLLNKQTFSTLLAAITVGITYEIPLDECIDAVERLKLPPGRMTKLEGIRDTVIIDSSYNASCLSMLEALDNLALFKSRKKLAVLGDMRELGVESKSEHEEIAERAVEVADEIILIGPAMKNFFIPKAIELGFDKKKLHQFDNPWKALDYIREELIKGGEAILIKGSQNTLFLELIVEGIMRDKSKADELLCRRGSFWDKKRSGLRDLSRGK